LVFLSTVEDTFSISGRGCVVVPAVPRSSLDFRLRAQDPIQLRTPDGRVLDTYVAGIEMICGPKVVDPIAFLLPENVTQQDVPKGTEIWLIQE
jgi:translation elongation factor EF-Tu-like GTPase